MMGVTWLCVVAVVLTVGADADRGGSSLRGALEALQRRQRSRVHPPLVIPDYDALYEFVPPQSYPENDYSVDIEEMEENPRYVNVKLLDDIERPPEAYEYKLIKKKNTHFEMTSPNKQESAFRERAHHPNNDKLRDLFMDKNELEEEKKPVVNEKDAEYALLLGQLWSKYKYSKEHENNMESSPQGVVKLYKDKVVKKRYSDNWGPIAYKRKRSSGPNGPILPDYADRKPESGTLDPNYGTYELNDDDKDDIREEYSIAFQPLDDDSLSDLADEDQYTYDNSEKRFPVAKRSSGPYDFGAIKKTQNQNKREAMKTFRSSSGTDPKILKDLSKIFGDSTVHFIKNPVKRSSEHIEGSHEPPMVTVNHNHTQEHNHSIVPDDNSHETHGTHMHHPGFSGKDEEEDHDHSHEHVNDHKHDHDHKHNDKEAEKPIILKKKSIDWSDYFGIDKRIKKPTAFMEQKDGAQNKLRKQYFDTFNKEVIYPLNSFRRHSFVKRNFIKPKPSEETEIQVDRTQAVTIHNDEKRNVADDNDSKLDNIDKKLKSMEGFIVDEALHFSANVGDELDTKEEQEMKEKLLSRLAAAYSLEKMRKALKEFKHSLQTQRPDYSDMSPVPTDEAKQKRVAVKKELVNNEIPISNKHQTKNDDFEDEQGAGHYLNGKVEEQFSEGYMGGSGRHRVPVMSTVSADDGSCPVLTKIVQRCRNVDLLAGDRGQLFLPLCSLHQICYLCGEAPPTTCDLVFLSEADTTCEGDMSCQRAARSALMALRELHDNLADELDGECEASPCLAATLKLNVGWQRALQR